MARVGKLTNTGDLHMAGELISRLPPVTGGLVAHYPFDGTLNRGGGTNLYTGTKDFIGTWQAYSWWTKDTEKYKGFTVLKRNSYWSGLYQKINVVKGEKYVLSAYVKCELGSVISVHSSAAVDTGTIVTIDKDNIILIGSNEDATSWRRLSFAFTVTNDTVPLPVRFENRIQGKMLYICGLKLERGNKATPWTPAHEDNYTDELVASNCTLTDDGIYVEEATTNLWNGLTTTGSSGNWSVIDNPFPSTPFPRPNKIIKCGPKAGMNYYTTINKDQVTYPLGTTFTMQAWCFVEQDCDCKGSIFICGEQMTQSESLYNKSALGTWQHLQFTVTSTASIVYPTGAFYFLLYCNTGGSENTWTKGNVYFANVQVEARKFPTSYTEGNRPGGYAKLFNNETTQHHFPINSSWSLNIKAKKNSADANSRNYRLLSCTERGGFNIESLNSRLRLAFSDKGTYKLINFNSNYPFDDLMLHDVTIIYDLSNLKVSLFLDGVKQASEPITSLYYDSTQDYSFFIGSENNGLGGSEEGTQFNGIFKDLSIYNRALTDDEVKKLANNKFSVTSAGNLIASDITEGYINVPSDAYYYPLDFKSMDRNKIYSAAHDNNTAYEDGAVWVGSNVTNYSINGNAETGTATGFYQPSAGGAGTTIAVSSTERYSGMYSMSLTKGTDTSQTNMSHYYGIENRNTFGNVSGKTLTSTVKVKASRPGIKISLLVQRNGNDYQSKYFETITSTGDWQTLSGTLTFNTTYTDDCYSRVCFTDHTSSKPGDIIYIDEWMITDTSYVTPFTPTTRDTSRLDFNLYESIGMDWSKDWSIVYWKKPVATSSNDLTGFNIESLGCNSNTVGKGYVWWGKDTAKNALLQSTPTSIDPAKYFGNWRMISLQKKGTNILIKEWSATEGIYTRNFATTDTVANYYVTQYGYDFKLGGWDNGNPCNSYYRDLIVTKNRCMTDTEVSNLYKRKMAQKDTLYLQGQLIEGAQL